MEPNLDLRLKILFIGPEASGKSCLASRLTKDTFDPQYRKTSGVEVGGHFFHDPYRMQVWDATGDETMKNVTRSYYRSCQLLVACFDCRQRSQFDQMPKLVREFRSLSQPAEGWVNAPPPQLLLVSTHSDFASERRVSVEEAERLATDNDMHYLDFSSRIGSRQVVKAKVLEMLEKWSLSKQL